ncbi:MAG: DNA cytosine methyltransferase, partial [Gammaproteobacteria bacterium]|nr:DNA cytosine methyltransferase [Gammaproteobacteria bacterium]
THGPGTPNHDYETVRNWIEHLPPIGSGEEHPTVSNHRAAGLSALNVKRIEATPEGGGHRDWPDELKLACHKDFSGYTDIYGRMSWDAPASGLTTRCISYSNGRFGHPEQDRAISVREAACLQTFPDEFAFEGALNSMARQIGNAVPVRLAEVVGKQFVSHLKDVGMMA